MSAIVPRWEWRTFGTDLGDAERRFAAITPERVQESDEVYLLSTAGGDTVKVRDGLMDVKHLEDVDAAGLECWFPVLKAGFPLPAADVAAVLAALNVEAPPLERDAYTLPELMDEVVRPRGDLRAVDVHKRRVRYTVGGCMAEVTEVSTDSVSTHTIAIESEDPDRVVAAKHELGLDARANVSFPAGLKVLIGYGAHRYAVLDVGTNSVKFHLAELGSDGTWRKLGDRAAVTRLGEGVQETGRLGDEPAARTLEAIASMVDEAHAHGAEAIVAVGTEGLRRATNSGAFVDEVRERTGVEIEVVSGEDEARLAYLAAQSGLGLDRGHDSLVVFDTGGGSSQFTFGHGTEVDERFSVDVGAVRFTERFGLDGAVSPETLQAALEAIAADLVALDGRERPALLVGMGGAVTNLAAVKHHLAAYEPDVVQGTVLDGTEIDRQLELYRTRNADERRTVVGLQPARAEVILAGACVVRTVLRKLGVDSLTVSDRGLRHGVLAERFGRSTEKGG